MGVSLVQSVIRSTCNTCSNVYTPRRFRRVAHVLKCHVLLSSGCGRSGQRSGDRGCVCVCWNGLVFHSQKDLRYRAQMACVWRVCCFMVLFVMPASLGPKKETQIITPNNVFGPFMCLLFLCSCSSWAPSLQRADSPKCTVFTGVFSPFFL